ncbi:hypothetical protein PNO31109_01673 [Pandoraea nosoerga]|uniref:Uncharacterized protein n=1 Tax=Pandoraea nosoerga TaxID=2508296 RepID=A0A5E4U030_9BURK|nr:hypothetical protein PNO31109_01673 [Pandoraea nosoerga]
MRRARGRGRTRRPARRRTRRSRGRRTRGARSLRRRRLGQRAAGEQRRECRHAQQGHRKTGVFVGREAEFAARARGDLVVKLNRFRRESLGQTTHVRRFRPVVGDRLRRELRQCNFVQQTAEILQSGGKRKAALGHFVGDRQQIGAGFVLERVEQAHEHALVDGPKHAAHGRLGERAGRIGDGLIGERERVAHAAARRLGEQAQRLWLVLDALFAENIRQMRHDMARRHLLQVELQAAREHGDWNLLRIGRRQNELDVRGRLLERLEHRVESVPGEHVHFVDHVDLEARVSRRVDRLFQQRRHLVDAAVGRCVHFDVVDETALVDGAARLAHPARRCRDPRLAIERLGQNARQRSLADAARTGKQIGVMQTLLLERVRQRTHDMLLAHQGREAFGAPFAREYLIGHAKL